MWTLGDVLEGALRFVRDSGAPRVAALWALGAFVVGAVLIRIRQDSVGLKLGSSLLAIGGAAGVLLWWSLQPEHVYYRHVDEVVATGPGLRLRRADIKVHGCVVRESIEQRMGTDQYRFRIESAPWRPRAEIEARYAGRLPDMFRSNAEIVATGRLDQEGRLQIVPDGILTMCPGKRDPGASPYLECARPGS